MSPCLNSKVISLREVPFDDLLDEGNTLAGRAPVVLIVDDEPLVANTLAAILTRSGFVTRVAYDGPTALTVALKVMPALLISDVAMPGMTGVELALRLLQDQPACKVLLFSGHATHADLLPAVAAGYDFTLLSKPVHPAEMLQNIARCLETPAAKKTWLRQPLSASKLTQSAA